MAECWGRGTATFMIGGDICTRACKFCAVKTGMPELLDPQEPENVADSIKRMKVKHAVITSVDRDDLKDGGAAHWVATIEAIKAMNPETTFEVLIPDFKGNKNLIQLIIDAKPHVISHNMETVERLTPLVRNKAKYRRSLEVIQHVAESGIRSKTGIMLGLGEREDEVLQTLDDLEAVGCEVVTLGQYLQPTKSHIPVSEYVELEQFEKYRQEGLERGFRHVESGPFVRSSYHAEKHVL